MSDENKKPETNNYPKEIVDKLFFDFDETEMIVIKAHLFIEYMLNIYIQFKNKSEIDFDKMNFTFNHKINISKILGLFLGDDELENYVTNLNKLRNQIAHRHTYDNDLYDKIVNYPESFNPTGKWKTKKDFKIGIMAIKSSWMCGRIQSKIDHAEITSMISGSDDRSEPTKSEG